MRRCRALLGWSLWGGLSLVLSAPALADSLHAQSQVQSSGHLAVEERGYEVFIEPRPKGQSSLRLRITYFNSSSQPMDMVSRLAVPANSEIVGVAVQGDHGWIAGGPSQPRVQKDEIQGVYATLVPSHERNGSSAIAELVGRQLPAQAYTAIELQLNVPVQRLLDHERLCLAPRMIQGPGLQSHRRVSLRDSHGKAMAFFVDGTPQSEPSTRLPANRGGCISWFAPQRYRNPLHFDFYAYAPSDQGHRFALDLALGPQAQRPTQGLSVMLDASSSVETQTFARGVQLYATIQKLGIQGTGLWSFDRHLARSAQQRARRSTHPARAVIWWQLLRSG